MSSGNNNKTPILVTVVAGFLGAGKTTLINHILTGEHGLRIGVVVNDFGSINIDADLISDVNEGMVSLANGCICCIIRNDLISAVLKLADTKHHLDHILIESSGVAYPESVVKSLMIPEIRSSILLDGVITLVDAEQLLLIDDEKAQQMAMKQIEDANLVILNKTDLVSDETIKKVHNHIANINSGLQIVPASHSQVPLEILLGIGGEFTSKTINTDGLTLETNALSNPIHHIEFDTWTFESLKPLRLNALQLLLKHIPKTVYRIKGFVNSIEKPEKRILLQMVGRRATLSVINSWDNEMKQTRLVFIAEKETINYKAIQGALDECIIQA